MSGPLVLPGDAFLQNEGTDANPIIVREARKGFAIVSSIGGDVASHERRFRQ